MEMLIWTVCVGLLVGWVAYLNAPSRNGGEQRVALTRDADEPKFAAVRHSPNGGR